MKDLKPPFFAIEGGDVSIYEFLDRMASHIEAYDVGVIEFFDARGRPLKAATEGYRVVTFVPLPAAPNPERLETLLREYFIHLTERERGTANAAAEAQSLDELVKIFLEFDKRPRPGLLRRIFGKGG